MNPQAVGESAITQQVQQQVSPDVQNQQGQQQLLQKAVEAHKTKNLLNGVLKSIAEKAGGKFDSRVKNIETASAKISQKRIQGRDDYGIDDINDMAGFRLTLPSKSKFSPVKKALEQLSDMGVFKITKQEDVKQGTYRGTHIDIQMPNGESAEVQLHLPQTALEAVSNHTLRSQFGEKPQNDAVEQLRDKQAQIAKSLPNDKANKMTDIMQQIMKQQGGQLQPQQSAQLLAMASSK